MEESDSSRPSPPVLRYEPDGTLQCPLCSEKVDHHPAIGAFVCDLCRAYWLERHVVAGAEGSWDDSGHQCGAVHVPRGILRPSQPRLVCALGSDHVVEDAGTGVVHISIDGWQWSGGEQSESVVPNYG